MQGFQLALVYIHRSRSSVSPFVIVTEEIPFREMTTAFAWSKSSSHAASGFREMKLHPQKSAKTASVMTEQNRIPVLRAYPGSTQNEVRTCKLECKKGLQGVVNSA
jgi:hypothetical protein